jgi:hypothetical protein
MEMTKEELKERITLDHRPIVIYSNRRQREIGQLKQEQQGKSKTIPVGIKDNEAWFSLN